MKCAVLLLVVGCVAEPSDATTTGASGVNPGLPHARLVFAADFTQHREGVLAPGGDVELAYAISRLDNCAQTQGGHPQWDLTAHVRFEPGMQLASASVRDGAVTIPVATDARRMVVWFEETSVSGCHGWDSSYGANYVFDMQTPPAWIGLAQDLITRDASDPCDGGGDVRSGFQYDTWARQRAGIANLCFQVYQPGVTDRDENPWQVLDAELHWRVAGAAWTVQPVAFDRRVGNNARFAISWRGLDPFRPYHCPEATPAPSGDYVQLLVEYFITVNGGEVRPEPGAAFGGYFSDYPTNDWRSANCPQ